MGEGDNHDQRAAAATSLDLKNLNVISPLGRGAKGVVFLVRSADGESLALKIVLRELLEKSTGSKKKSRSDGALDGNISSSGQYRRISFEEDVLASLNHPLFPKLRGVLQTDQIVGYAIDYCPGRDLNTLRKRQTEKMFSDDIIRFYAAEIVLALEYLHGMGIVYRDLKPENVMIQESGHLMLVDFDLSTKLSIRSPEPRRSDEPTPESPAVAVNNTARRRRKKKGIFSPLSLFCKSGIVTESDSVHPVEFSSESASQEEGTGAEKSNSFVGTEDYLAPEVVSGNGHDFSVDWWCLGVMMYEMLYGTTPFRGIDRKETYYRILVKSPELVGEPTPLRDLIGKLLEKEPKQRISLEEIKGHEFFKNVDWDHVLEISRPPFIPPVEGRKGNVLEIDVESFVQEIFQVEENDEKLENKKYSGNKNKGELVVEGLNKNPHPENQNFLEF